jgi:hypothetical protein
MRFAKKFVPVVLALATCIPAIAQNGDKTGVFNLQHDTRWNNVVIPAGAYSISVYASSHSVSVLRPENTRQSAVFVVPVSLDYGAGCASSTVSLANVAGEWRAQSVCFADTGLTLYFAVPRSSGGMVASTSAPKTLIAAGGSH